MHPLFASVCMLAPCAYLWLPPLDSITDQCVQPQAHCSNSRPSRNMSCNRSSRKRQRSVEMLLKWGQPHHLAGASCPRPCLFRMRRTGWHRQIRRAVRPGKSGTTLCSTTRCAIQRLAAAAPASNSQGASASWLARMQPRVVGIFLCSPYPQRSPSSPGSDNLPGNSDEGVQQQMPSCCRFCALFAWSAVCPPLSPKQFDAYLL